MSQTDGDGDVTSYVNDSEGRVLHQETRNAAGVVVSQQDNTYDKDGNLLTSTDGDGLVTASTWDGDGNKLTQTTAYGTSQAATTTFQYDEDNNLVEITDPDNNHTYFSYDGEGNQVSTTDALGHTSTMTYDPDGRLLSKTDKDGRRIDFSYDATGNLTGQQWYDANSNLVQTESWVYDQAGRLLSASNSAGTYTFQYDAAGHVTHVEEPFGVSLDMGYDLAANRTSVTDSLGGSETSTYDGNLLISRVLTQAGLTLREDFRYDLAGNVVSETRSSDAAGTTVVATTALAWDGANRLTSEVDNAAGGAQLASFTFSYDTASRLTSQNDNGLVSNYSYDKQGQLTSDSSSNYSYDAAGNPSGPGFIIGPGNQLLSDGVWNYSYDNEGNLVQKVNLQTGEVWSYTYDNKNQMTSATHQASGQHVDVAVTFAYDVFGNLIDQDTTVYPNGSDQTTTVRYAWDGWKTGGLANPVGNENWDVWADLDGNNALVTRYLHTNGVDDLVGRLAPGSGVFWTLTDYQGSIRLVLDGSGNVLDSVRYDGFGNIVAETASQYRGNYGYAGGVLVIDVGMYEFGMRWYDPAANRWTTIDPKGIDSGDFNWYRYLGNAPTNATDPSGLDPLPIPLPRPGLLMGPPVGSTWPPRMSRAESEKWAREIVDRMIKETAAQVAKDPKIRAEIDAAARADDMEREKIRELLKGTKKLSTKQHVLAIALTPDAIPLAIEINAAIRAKKAAEEIAAKARRNQLLGMRLEEMLAPKVAEVIAGPAAGQRVAMVFAIKKALDKGEKGRAEALRLLKSQAFLEFDRALDQFKPCDVDGVPGLTLRVRATVKGAQALQKLTQAVRDGNWPAAIAAAGEASSRLEQAWGPCFVAGTLVLTREGYKPIEQVRKGDWVLALPEDDPNGPLEWRRVEEVYVNQAAVTWVDVWGQRIGTTAPHGFGVEDKGWVPAGELIAGDVLRSHDGQRPVVEGVSGPGEFATVYNLKVEGYHTYFVGSPDWGFSVWVHNGDGDNCTKATGSPGEKPKGAPIPIPKPGEDKPENIRALKRENESADILAAAGFKTERRPTIPGTTKKPDYLVEGKVFDCYAPESPRARNIASNIDTQKIQTKQTERIVLNLEDSPVTIDEMKKQLIDYPISGLKEVIAIKDGKVVQLYSAP